MPTFALPLVLACLTASIVGGLMLSGDAQVWTMVISTLAILLIPATSKRVAGVLAGRMRLLVGLGIGMAVLSVAVMVAVIGSGSDVSARMIGLSIWPMLAGGSVGYLPFMSRNMNRAWSDMETARRNPPVKIPAARAKGDVAEALRLLLQERGALAWTVGPWFAIYCALPLALIALQGPDLQSKAQAGATLLILVAFLLLLVCLPLVASIRWARYLATGVRSSILGIPAGALWGVFWRLVIAGAVLRVVNGAEPWLKSQLPAAEPWVLSGLAGLFSLLVLVAASPWAMIFIAVALGATDRSSQTALRMARSGGRGVYFGMLLILAPGIFLVWLMDFVPSGTLTSPLTWLAYLALALVYFLTLVMATTYLTQIYIRNLLKAPAPSMA